jgi:hypothetical protein
MVKKLLAGLSALALALGMIALVATPASAHTGDLNVSAVCNTTTGNYDLTATLTISQTNESGSTLWKVGDSDFTGTPTSSSGLDRGPVSSTGAQTVTLGTFSIPGTTTGLGPWVYAFTTWSPDNYKKGSDGQLYDRLAGDCKVPIVPKAASVNLTYLSGCAPDSTNTWRVTNSSSFAVPYTYQGYGNSHSGSGTVDANSTTTFDTPRGTETMVVSWGGGDSGIVAGSVTKASGVDDNGLSCHPPVTCVATGGFSSDEGDVAPTLTPEGLTFAGPSAKAIDTYQRVTAGNAQGITALSVTYAAGGTGQPAQVVIEINPHTTLSYATLSTNLVAPSGTINLLDSSVLWSTTKIASGPGSLSSPIPYTSLVALFPANTLLSAPSLHLLSNSTDADLSVVTAISSSCGSASFVPTKPEPLRTTTAVSGDTVCSTDGGGSYTVTTHYWEQDPVWNDDTHSYSPASDSARFEWQAPTTQIVTVGTDVCPTQVTPKDPSVTDQSCDVSENGDGSYVDGYIDIPDVAGVAYFIDGKPAPAGQNALAPGRYTVTATADDGYQLLGSPEGGWIRTIAAADACGSLITFPDVTPQVAFTQLGCTTGGSYSLSNDLGAADAVVWTVDGSPVAEGSYVVTAARTVTVHAAPNGPRYGFSFDQQTDWSFTFAVPANCQLTTLALGTLAQTGVVPVGGMVVASFLLIAGLGLVTVRRVRRRAADGPKA